MAVLNAVPLIQTVAGNAPVNMQIHGPLIAVEIAHPAPPTPAAGGPAVPTATTPVIIPGFALVDTGASGTVIDDAAAKTLGLIATGTTPACGVNGPYQATQYAVNWRIAGIPQFNTIPVTDGPIMSNQNLLMIIGRDILSSCMLVYNGLSGTFSLSW